MCRTPSLISTDGFIISNSSALVRDDSPQWPTSAAGNKKKKQLGEAFGDRSLVEFGPAQRRTQHCMFMLFSSSSSSLLSSSRLLQMILVGNM